MTLLLPAFVGAPELNRVYHTDLFTLCAAMPDNSVDMILCDLPYGTTACSWDEIIPFVPMRAAFKRVIKPRGAIVLTASQPFTSKLVCSNLEMFKYQWVWVKSRSTGFVNASKQPLRRVEDVLIFNAGKYYPQDIKRVSLMRKNGKSTGGASLRTDVDKSKNKGSLRTAGSFYIQEFTGWPDNILYFDSEINTTHPTQKPVALFEYLIRTYTQPGELVFDPCIGSGTTALAARNEGRNFIGGDLELKYVDIARRRLAQPYTVNMFANYSLQFATPST